MTERDSVLAAFDALSERLTPPGAWCQKAYAKRADGGVTDGCDPQAVQWCIYGACANLGIPRSVEITVLSVLGGVLRRAGGAGLVAFSDAPGRTQAEVLDLIARARARYEAEVPS